MVCVDLLIKMAVEVGKMNLTKRILVPIISLIFLSTPISVNFCLPTEPSTEESGSSFSCEENNPDHHQTTSHDCPNNKSPCQYAHSCCILVTHDTISYLFVLDSYPLNSAEILFQPLEMTKSLYRPPKFLL